MRVYKDNPVKTWCCIAFEESITTLQLRSVVGEHILFLAIHDSFPAYVDDSHYNRPSNPYTVHVYSIAKSAQMDKQELLKAKKNDQYQELNDQW